MAFLAYLQSLTGILGPVSAGSGVTAERYNRSAWAHAEHCLRQGMGTLTERDD